MLSRRRTPSPPGTKFPLYDTGVDVPSGSHILTLSTCRSAYASNNQRFVVHAIMEPINHAQ